MQAVQEKNKTIIFFLIGISAILPSLFTSNDNTKTPLIPLVRVPIFIKDTDP